MITEKISQSVIFATRRKRRPRLRLEDQAFITESLFTLTILKCLFQLHSDQVFLTKFYRFKGGFGILRVRVLFGMSSRS